MIEIDDMEVRAALGAMIGRLADPRELYETVGLWQEQRIEQRIEEEKVSPDGMPWAEWRLPTLKRRTAKGNVHQGILWDRGDLLHSFGFEIGDGVEIGTYIGYADALQEGTLNMEARPFAGWSPEDLQELEMMAITYVETGELIGGRP